MFFILKAKDDNDGIDSDTYDDDDDHHHHHHHQADADDDKLLGRNLVALTL